MSSWFSSGNWVLISGLSSDPTYSFLMFQLRRCLQTADFMYGPSQVSRTSILSLHLLPPPLHPFPSPSLLSLLFIVVPSLHPSPSPSSFVPPSVTLSPSSLPNLPSPPPRDLGASCSIIHRGQLWCGSEGEQWLYCSKESHVIWITHCHHPSVFRTRPSRTF